MQFPWVGISTAHTRLAIDAFLLRICRARSFSCYVVGIIIKDAERASRVTKIMRGTSSIVFVVGSNPRKPFCSVKVGNYATMLLCS